MAETEAQRDTTRQAASDAMVRTLIAYGVQLAIIAALIIITRQKPRIEAAAGQVARWYHRDRDAERAAMLQVRREISWMEHGQ